MQPYNLDVIKNERIRIDTRLKQRGYYYFNPDDLLIRADSMVGDHQVDMTLIVKKSTPEPAREVYRINDVVVFANYNCMQIPVLMYPVFPGITAMLS